MFKTGQEYLFSNIENFAKQYSNQFEYVEMRTMGEEIIDENIIQINVDDYYCTFVYSGFNPSNGGVFKCIHQTDGFFKQFKEDMFLTMYNATLLEDLSNNNYTNSDNILIVSGFCNERKMDYIKFFDETFYYYDIEHLNYDAFIMRTFFDENFTWIKE